MSFDNQDHYAVLELELTATPLEISKAYKKLALKWHPDRNPDNPLAAEKFLSVHHAFEILANEETRGKFDKIVRAKILQKQKFQQMDDQRRRMREDLEAREAASKKVRVSEQEDRDRVQREVRATMFAARGVNLTLLSQIERLREEGQAILRRMQEQREQRERASVRPSVSEYDRVVAEVRSMLGGGVFLDPRVRSYLTPSTDSAAAAPPVPASDVGASAASSVRLRWDAAQGALSTDALRSAMLCFGAVASVLSRKAGAAHVIFERADAAYRAALQGAVDVGSVRVSVTAVDKDTQRRADAARRSEAVASPMHSASAAVADDKTDTVTENDQAESDSQQQEQQQQQQPDAHGVSGFSFPGAPATAAPAATASRPAFASFAAFASAPDVNKQQQQQQQQQPQSFSSFASFPAFAGAPTAGGADYESAVLARLRQTESRKRSDLA